MNIEEIKASLDVVLESIESRTGKPITTEVREMVTEVFKAGWELGYEARFNEEESNK